MNTSSLTTYNSSGKMDFFPVFDLPPEILSRIISYCSYDAIGELRLVCKVFDTEAQKLLNLGFQRVERFHSSILHRVKAQLPRRESERRTHALARHNEILTSVETRISLLTMTFTKYIDAGMACFIPGKVLDELFRVLREVDRCVTSKVEPERPHDVLQELRDISSMAMEYFDEKIAHRLRDKATSSSCPGSTQSGGARYSSGSQAAFSLALISGLTHGLNLGGGTTGGSESVSGQGDDDSPPCADPAPARSISPVARPSRPAQLKTLAADTARLTTAWKTQNRTLASYKKALGMLKAAHTRLQKKLNDQHKQMGEQNRRIDEMARKYDFMIAELKSRLPSTCSGSDDQQEAEQDEAVRNKTKTVHRKTGTKRKKPTPDDKSGVSEHGPKEQEKNTARVMGNSPAKSGSTAAKKRAVMEREDSGIDVKRPRAGTAGGSRRLRSCVRRGL